MWRGQGRPAPCRDRQAIHSSRVNPGKEGTKDKNTTHKRKPERRVQWRSRRGQEGKEYKQGPDDRKARFSILRLFASPAVKTPCVLVPFRSGHVKRHLKHFLFLCFVLFLSFPRHAEFSSPMN